MSSSWLIRIGFGLAAIAIILFVWLTYVQNLEKAEQCLNVASAQQCPYPKSKKSR